jgi:hypothetical protein
MELLDVPIDMQPIAKGLTPAAALGLGQLRS